MIAYKLCLPATRPTEGWSITSYKIMHYAVEKTTVPDKYCGPLCCFSSPEWAWHFNEQLAHNWSYCPIRVLFKCEIVESKENNVWTQHIHDQILLPTGTVLCDAVTPLELAIRP